MTGKTLYFAYGSNLSTARMHVWNPNAIRCGIGKLNDYVVDFLVYSKIWKGCAGTIVPKKGSHVWGVIWELKDEDLKNLDWQEGVHVNIYEPITVTVETPEGKLVECLTYQQVRCESEDTLEYMPELKPSPAYLNTMVRGAVESKIPLDYINFIKDTPTNDSNIEPNLRDEY
ncbi:gamma-glutamylcyclotransferase [Leptinotarsa decemlineata]|uniref:gamma-glutamylcyclotransferase n=1 Tax=Leptinotarsa decemlineata TaxID=7539 RepID=UPI003D30D327